MLATGAQVMPSVLRPNRFFKSIPFHSRSFVGWRHTMAYVKKTKRNAPTRTGSDNPFGTRTCMIQNFFLLSNCVRLFRPERIMTTLEIPERLQEDGLGRQEEKNVGHAIPTIVAEDRVHHSVLQTIPSVATVEIRASLAEADVWTERKDVIAATFARKREDRFHLREATLEGVTSRGLASEADVAERVHVEVGNAFAWYEAPLFQAPIRFRRFHKANHARRRPCGRRVVERWRRCRDGVGMRKRGVVTESHGDGRAESDGCFSRGLQMTMEHLSRRRGQRLVPVGAVHGSRVQGCRVRTATHKGKETDPSKCLLRFRRRPAVREWGHDRRPVAR